MERQYISSGNRFEAEIGFSRAVRVGPHVAVSGTAAIGPDGRTVGVGDAAAQARRCYEIIGEALRQAGATFEDVIRTRTMLTHVERDWQAVGAVRAAQFDQNRPADTVVEVSRFINPEWLVEIEVDAILPE